MDVIQASGKISIQLQPRELRDGGWMADFTLIEHQGFETLETPYFERSVFPGEKKPNEPR